MGKFSNSADDRDRFDLHGPKDMMDLDAIDWAKEEHRRRIAACLVKGVYVHENDRDKHRAVKLAPAWWESFGFRLEDEIRDTKYSSTIYGAIFKHTASQPCAPRYVVAFRGTRRNIRDYYYDLKIVMNKLEKRTRCMQACATIEGLMSEEGQDGCIWLAGHSLGAAVAQVVGRGMMEREKPLNLPDFLFNPPYVAFITSIKLLNLLKADPVAKRHFYFASSLLKAAAGLVLVSHRERRESSFKRFSAWVPNLYVHEDDWICRGFIGYFEAREEFKESLTRVGIWFKDHFGGRDKFKKIFARVGIWSMALSHCDVLSWALLGKDKEQPHLLPSVTLWKSRFQPKHAHDLRHWWKPDSELNLGAGTSYSCPVHEA